MNHQFPPENPNPTLKKVLTSFSLPQTPPPTCRAFSPSPSGRSSTRASTSRSTSWAPEGHNSNSSSSNSNNNRSSSGSPSSPPRHPSLPAGPFRFRERRAKTESRDYHFITKSALQSNCSDTLSYLVTCYMYMYSGGLDVVHTINVIDYIPCVPG